MSESNKAHRDFYERVGEKYPEEEIVYCSLRGMLRERFVLRWLAGKAGTLCDIGCGEGHYTRRYFVGMRIGVDISFSKVRKALQRDTLAQGDKVLYCVADAAHLPVRGQKISVALCSEVLEHVHEPERIVNEVARILVRGGEGLLTTPNYSRVKPVWSQLGIMRQWGLQETPDKRGYLHTAFKPHELASLVEKTGLQCADAGTFEKEVKYATKVPRLIQLIVLFWGSIFRYKIDEVNLYNTLENIAISVYRLMCFLRLNGLLVSCIKRGVRAYAIAEKCE